MNGNVASPVDMYVDVDIEHLRSELAETFERDRERLRAVALRILMSRKCARICS